MKKLLTLALLLTAASLTAATKGEWSYKTSDQQILIQFYSPSIVRVLKSPIGHEYSKTELCVTAVPKDVALKVSEKGGSAVIRSSELSLSVDKATGAVSFSTAKGVKLLSEQGAATFEEVDDAGVKAFTASQSWTLLPDEQIYGLGQSQDGRLTRRGFNRKLTQGNQDDAVPVWQSTKGYGIFWDNYSATFFEDSPEATTMRSDVADCVEYYFMWGGNSDGVVRRVRELTGDAPMFPLWTYGFFQSKERYRSQDELLGVVKRYREDRVPLDGIIQDCQYWCSNYLWNAMEFLNEEFPEPQKAIDSIHAAGAKMLISIWQSFGPRTKQYRILDSLGLLFPFQTWPQSGISHVWPPKMDYPSGVKVYDPYSPVARDVYWTHLRDGLLSHGIDGWWMDSTEPDHFYPTPEDFLHQTAMGSFRRMCNAYPLMTVGGVFEHQRAEFPQKRIFILTRSGFAGIQRYCANIWTGDITTSWDVFRAQIPAGINFSMSGVPHWNTDIGGFFVAGYKNADPALSGPRNPQWQEIFVRWMQFGALCPMMRSHGADFGRELYLVGSKGESVYDAALEAIRLRYRLLPYIYSTSWAVTHKGESFIRPLSADFVKDPNTTDIASEYLLGHSLLVAPVLEPQYTPEERLRLEELRALGSIDWKAASQYKVYLPAGASWWHFFSGKKYSGGASVNVPTTLDSFPLFVKAGSVLPIGPDVQYSSEKDWKELEIRVYPGADGSFTFYEDEGDGYGYENGEYSEIDFIWKDSSHTLSISARRGSFPKMIAERTFRICLPDGSRKSIDYKGEKISVRLF